MWYNPPVTAVAVLMLLTESGELLSVEEPLPNCPKALSPQHWTVLSESTAQVWFSPALIPVAVLMLLTETGVLLSVVEPLPNCPW